MSKEILRPQNKPAPVQQKPVECLDCGSHNVGIPATYDSLVNSVKAQPEQEQNEFELRGKLAALLCWHRLTQAEQEDLLRYAAAQPEQEHLGHNGWGFRIEGFEPDWANFQEGRKVGRAEALERAWVDLTRQQFLDVTNDLEDLEDCWIQIQAKLKEVNIQ